jgi:hypothetical protein
MFPYKMLICFLVFGTIIGMTPMICAETTKTDREKDRVNYLSQDWQTKQKTGPQEQYQFFSPPKPSGEEKFLILNPDGQTSSDYQRLLDEPPQADKKPRR